jgi:hypothetical protein
MVHPMIRKLLTLLDEYVSTMRVGDIAALKLCLLALGTLLGMTLPNRERRSVWYAACGLFAMTYAATATPFAQFLFRHRKDILSD